ncbi:MAG: OmpH family outer membrane protein [Rhodothermales bacterium]
MIKTLTAAFGLVLLAMPFLVAGDANAQALKLGYTDHEIIIVNMPEYQEIQKQLQEDYQGSQQELQTLYQDYQQQVERYQKQQSLMSEDKRSEREQELLQLQQSIQKQAQEKDQSLAVREAELMKPVLEKVQLAIDSVSQAKGLDLVLRTQVGQQPVLLYVNPNTVTDITLDVARELGLDVTDDEAADATSSQ